MAARGALRAEIHAAGKACAGCLAVKAPADFYPQRRNASGLTSRCRACYAEVGVDREHRTRWLNRKYGLTAQEYDALLSHQRGLCAFCGQSQPPGGKHHAVDHAHATGVIRGLLCDACNRGKVSNNNIATAEKLLDYLKNPPAVAFFGEARAVRPADDRRHGGAAA